jgi:ATP-binding cassette subfamily F protein 3
MHQRAFSIEKRIERMEKTEKPKQDRQMENQFKRQNFSGQEVVIVQNLVKAFSEPLIINHLDFQVQKGERVAVLGDNGSGKSTLLKIITGEVGPDSGMVKLGPSIRYAYLPQLVTFLEPAATILETVQKELRLDEEKARCLLAKFNFKGEDVCKALRSLSGGEKSRLKLCLIMQQEVNLLLLDEPTNHLDILSREWLENALAEFPGTMIFVSHDRYFINQFATRIAELKNGQIRDYQGNYDSYKMRQSAAALSKAPPTKTRLKNNPASKSAPKPDKTPATSESTGLVAMKLETAITARESQLAEIDGEMQLAGHDFEKLDALYQKRLEIEAELTTLYDQWSAIEVKR